MATVEKEKPADFTFAKAVVVAFEAIINPRAFKKKGQEKGDPKYSGTFVCEPTDEDLKKLQGEVSKMLQAHNASGKKLKVGLLTEEQEKAGTHISVNVPWQDGTKYADKQKAAGKDAEWARGKILVKATSKYQPALAAIEGGKVLEFTTPEAVAVAKKYFYSGAYIVPSVGLHYYTGDSGKPDGVSLYFNAALFVKHGARIAGQRSATETFKGYIGSISVEDPTGGATEELDDEIAF
jgi:hypothetical protein